MNGTTDPKKKTDPSQPEEPLFEAFPQPAGWALAWEPTALEPPVRPAKPAAKLKRQPRT